MLAIAIEVHDPAWPDPQCGRALCPVVTRDRRTRCRPGSFGTVGEREPDVLLRDRLLRLVLEEHHVSRAVADDVRVDHAEAVLIEELRRRETLEIGRRDVIDAMVVLPTAAADVGLWESAGDRRRPVDHE